MRHSIFATAAATIALVALTPSPAQARFLQSDPVGYDGGHNLYGYAMNDPVNFVDFNGNAPNRAGVTDYQEVANRINEGGITAVSENGTNDRRYVFTETYGWVDLRHFGTAVEGVLAGLPGPVVEIGGLATEIYQSAEEAVFGRSYKSGFSPEDLPSNSAGVSFGEFVLEKEGSGLSRAELFRGWAILNGSPEAGTRDYQRAVSALPRTDPADNGGTGRGSNGSSTPVGGSPSNRQGVSNRDAVCTGSTGTSAKSC